MVCVRGREREAYELLGQLDEFGWTLADLDMAMSFPRVATDAAMAHWRACELFAPERLAGRMAERLLLTDVDLSINYSVFPDIGLSSSDLGAAVLVSSQCVDGSHRPALDLDFPAALFADAAGGQWLWLDPAGHAIDYHGPEAINWADRAMAAVGLVRSSGPQGPLEDLAPLGRTAAQMASGWSGSFETLWQTLEHLEPTVRATRPDGGVWYQAQGRAQLVPSTSWWHLYTDVTLDAESYLSALDVLAACGILNSGFALASRTRRFSSLRTPGLLKPPPLPYPVSMDVDDIPF
jgi:hypothetical protein